MFRSFAALAIVITAAVRAAMGQGGDLYYPTKVGDKLVYESRLGDSVWDMTAVVTKVGTVKGILRVSSGVEEKGEVIPGSTAEVSDKGVFTVAHGKQNLRPPMPHLKLPATPGATWSWQPIAPNGAPGPKTTFTIIKEEEVEVPAGKFKAVRVDLETESAPNEPIRATTWFAPGVGLVKSVTDKGAPVRIQLVLKSFTPGK